MLVQIIKTFINVYACQDFDPLLFLLDYYLLYAKKLCMLNHSSLGEGSSSACSMFYVEKRLSAICTLSTVCAKYGNRSDEAMG
jgi:hypothetical protein